MAEPILDSTTERVYSTLPQHYRDRDILQNYQLKKFIGGLCSTQTVVNDVIDRIQYTPLDDGGPPTSTSDLVNPYTADRTWLKWLGQLFGTSVRGEVTDGTRNEIIQASGFRAGTTDSVIAAAQSVLVGSKKVRIIQHADTSWEPNMAETVYATNYAKNPQPVVSAGVWSAARVTTSADPSGGYLGTITDATAATVAQRWVLGSGTNPSLNGIPVQEGLSYSAQLDVKTNTGLPMVCYFQWYDASNVSLGLSHAVATTGTITSYTPLLLDQAHMLSGESNVAPPGAVWATLTVGINGTGARSIGQTMSMRNIIVTQTALTHTYFDGAKTTDSYHYRWMGTANKSFSQQYTPAITNTATYWDMLVMTLQSETLKNLLNPGLSKTLAPSVWVDDFESFGYDSTKVYRTLVDQPGVFQDRAYSYALQDPTWQASPKITSGFGGGSFGSGPFGYSNDVTSSLTLTSRSSVPVTPTDSYQFLVSLGLKQDLQDDKITDFGFQFFNSGGTVITNKSQTNLYPDPSFEYGKGNAASTPTNGTSALDTTIKHSGAQSLKLTTTTTGSAFIGGTNIGLANSFGLVAGDKVTMSGWVYVPSASTPYISGSRNLIFGMLGSAFAASVYADAPITRDGWAFVKLTQTVIEPTGTITPRFYGANNAGGVIYWDDIGVVKGTVPADFSGDSPDPLDGSVNYVWDGTAGASTSSALTDFFNTPIDITPTVINPAVVSHNLIKSSKATNYRGDGASPAGVTVSNFGKYEGGDVIRATVNKLATTSDFGLISAQTVGQADIPAGTLFVFSLDFYCDTNSSVDGIEVSFYDDSNGDNSAATFDSTTPAFVTATKGRWHTRHWIATVKPGRTVTSTHINVQSSSNQAQGVYFDTANWMLEEGSVANPYFNGDTETDDSFTYEWDGIPNESVTNKVLNAIAQSNIVTMEQFSTRFVAPTGAATAKVFIRMLGFNGKDTFYIAQPAMREEEDETWVPVTADPVQAILDKGVKPAGMILHWLPIISDWDTITANGTKTWDELRLTWTQLEELG